MGDCGHHGNPHAEISLKFCYAEVSAYGGGRGPSHGNPHGSLRSPWGTPTHAEVPLPSPPLTLLGSAEVYTFPMEGVRTSAEPRRRVGGGREETSAFEMVPPALQSRKLRRNKIITGSRGITPPPPPSCADRICKRDVCFLRGQLEELLLLHKSYPIIWLFRQLRKQFAREACVFFARTAWGIVTFAQILPRIIWLFRQLRKQFVRVIII